MANKTTPPDNNLSEDTTENPQNIATGKGSAGRIAAAVRIPVLKKGQKYVSPAGRHSQQTHRLAVARAATLGHASEKEQHEHDKNELKADITLRADNLLKQQAKQQNTQAAAKTTAPEAAK